MTTSSPPETFAARRVVCLDPRYPDATHVAIAGGRVIALGDAAAARDWNYPINSRFGDCVLTPGFVEAHGHLVSGGIWDFVYVGADSRTDPDGRVFTGLDLNQAVVARLRSEGSVEGAVVGWGFDPLFVKGERLDRHDLDGVAENRPVAVLHSNMHLMTVNSATLELVGYSRDSQVPGLVCDEQGEPTGELREFAAMFPVMRRLGIDFGDLGNSARALSRYGRMAVRSGVTTVSDMLNDLSDETVVLLRDGVEAEHSPIRLMAALNALSGTPESIRDRARELAAASTDRLWLGAAKIMTDGSIQGFTAQLQAPGYHRGIADPMWNVAPAALARLIEVLHRGGIQMHIHVNGDLAIEITISALEQAVGNAPPWDHRHTLQHFQMAHDSHIERLKGIGGGANLFANHLYYFGDQHHDITLGPRRASRLDPCGSALAAGLPFAIHSDTPVTPLAPLVTAGCAMHRRTRSGRILGAGQRLSASAALHAITLGAAWTLRKEHEVGSIAPGKRADFAILDADPLASDDADPSDIGVVGTILDGRVFLA